MNKCSWCDEIIPKRKSRYSPKFELKVCEKCYLDLETDKIVWFGSNIAVE